MKVNHIVNHIVKQAAIDYGIEEWEALKAYRTCYDYDKGEHDLEEFYRLLEEWYVSN